MSINFWGPSATPDGSESDLNGDFSQCPRCDWESSMEPPMKYPVCPRCSYPEPDERE